MQSFVQLRERKKTFFFIHINAHNKQTRKKMQLVETGGGRYYYEKLCACRNSITDKLNYCAYKSNKIAYPQSGTMIIGTQTKA